LIDEEISGSNIKFIRFNDSGKNMTIKKDRESKSFGIKFEFSGPRTSQRKGKKREKSKIFLEESCEC
jgi:hypothetical protein